MPKKVMDYSNTHFYKIVCKDVNIKDCYVGHTTNFTKRKHQHKTRCCNENNPKHHYQVYECIRENGHWENWDMVLIDKLDCESRLVALQKESEIIDK